MRPITWIGIAVAVLVVVGAGWYFKSSIKSLFVHQPATTTETPPVDPTASWQSVASSTGGFSVKYPSDFTLNTSYANLEVNPKKPIPGISFTIPDSMATGTNLAPDTRLSVEQLPRAKNCTGDIFLAVNTVAHEVLDNGLTYSLATSSDAGAGNRYDELVYAIKDSQPCTAVRYFVHYSAIENYPAGTVREFDRQALLDIFDKIRRTLQLNSGAPAPTASATSTP